MAEENEVGFHNLELVIEKPTLASDNSLVVQGNFSELEGKIKAVVARYKNTQLTEDNVNYVKTLKQHFVSLRTGIERERKEWDKVYIQPASKLIKSMCDELQKVVAEGEDALGSQLEAYDQKRKDELTKILKDVYIADSVARHNLRDEYATQIQLKNKYYNKSQNEEDSADDIEAQAVELEKKQKEYDNGVMLIKAECEDADILPDSYIRELSYKSAMGIILEIKQDKKTKAELVKKAEAEGKMTIGEDLDAELKKSMEIASKNEEIRTRVLRVTYGASKARLMARFFNENGIKFEFINTDF